eukprot:COSAG06_NODE_2202_length_7350_cov_14.567370_4_plen_169_part_00
MRAVRRPLAPPVSSPRRAPASQQVNQSRCSSLLFAPPASPPITRRLQRSKSSHIIVSHCCRGEGCSPPPCAACQLAPEGVCVSAKSERRQNGKVPVRLSEAPHSRVAFVAIWTIIRPSHSSRSCGVYGCQVCVKNSNPKAKSSACSERSSQASVRGQQHKQQKAEAAP